MTETLNHLYRHFDSDGNLLYVGISLNAVARLAQHKICSQWFSQITTITIENFPTRHELLSAEIEAIKNEKPLYNVQHRDSEVVIKERIYEAEKSRAESFKKFRNYKSIYRPNEAAEALKISKKKLKQHMDSGDIDSFFYGYEDGDEVYLITGWQLTDFAKRLERGIING